MLANHAVSSRVRIWDPHLKGSLPPSIFKHCLNFSSYWDTSLCYRSERAFDVQEQQRWSALNLGCLLQSVLMKGSSPKGESAKAGCCNFLCLGANNNSHQLHWLVGEQWENSTIYSNRIPLIYPACGETATFEKHSTRWHYLSVHPFPYYHKPIDVSISLLFPRTAGAS